MDKKLQKRITAGCQETARVARELAAAFSDKIPGAIKVYSNSRGVSVVSEGTIAKSGRPNEFGLRHPVFGDREVWRKTPHRPYMEVAEARTLDYVTEAAAGYLDDLIKDSGI